MKKLLNMTVNNILLIVFILFSLICFGIFMSDKEIPIFLEEQMYKKAVDQETVDILETMTKDGVITWAEWVKSCTI